MVFSNDLGQLKTLHLPKYKSAFVCATRKWPSAFGQLVVSIPATFPNRSVSIRKHLRLVLLESAPGPHNALDCRREWSVCGAGRTGAAALDQENDFTNRSYEAVLRRADEALQQ